MKTLEGHAGFKIAATGEHLILNDPRLCEALEAALRDCGGAIALWASPDGYTHAAELYGTVPQGTVAADTHDWLDKELVDLYLYKTREEQAQALGFIGLRSGSNLKILCADTQNYCWGTTQWGNNDTD